MQTSLFSKLPVALAVLALSASSVFAQNNAIVAPPTQISGVVPPPLPPGATAAPKSASTPLNAPVPVPLAAVSAPVKPVEPAVTPALSSSSDTLVLPPLPILPVVDKSSKDAGTSKTGDAALCAPAPVKKPDPTKPPAQKVSDKEAKAKDAVEKIPKPEAPPSPYAGLAQTQVSDTQLNQFLFPEPVEGIYFPEGSPLPECPKDASAHDPCKPIFLNGRQLLLLPMRVGAKGPVQMLVHLHSGRIITFNLAPVVGPGTVVRVEGADYAASDARVRKSAASASDEQTPLQADIALLDLFVNGQPASGFEAVAPNPVTKLDRFDIVPMAAWYDGGKLKVHLWKIQPKDGSPVVLSAALFQAEGVRAVALDKERATKASPAFVYVLEQLQ